jgi:hypothetical protein
VGLDCCQHLVVLIALQLDHTRRCPSSRGTEGRPLLNNEPAQKKKITLPKLGKKVNVGSIHGPVINPKLDALILAGTGGSTHIEGVDFACTGKYQTSPARLHG